MRVVPQLIALSIAAALTACSVDSVTFSPPVAIGGTIMGLDGTGLVLTNNDNEDLAISADGVFAFTNPLKHGASYAVVVKNQPSNPTQMCSVTNGTSNAGDEDVTDVRVSCHTMSFSVGGTVTGLAGSGLVLQNSGGDDLSVNADGTFTFVTPVPSKAAYGVTVKAQSTMPWQTCTVTKDAGMVTSANVTDVAVTCTTNRYKVGGTLSGLGAGDSITLRDNGGDDLVLSGDGNFAFPAQVTSGQPYAVTIVANPISPISQTCTVTSGAGMVAGSDVTGVQVTCTTAGFTIGGTVTRLAGAGLVLQNNGGDDLPITGDGPFTFTTPVASGATYDITVAMQPSQPTQVCTVTNGTGTVGASNVTNVSVTCVTSTFTIGGTVTGLVGSGLMLQNNGGDDLAVGADGSFTFRTPIASGSTFAVTVLTQPVSPSQTCTVLGGTGTVGGNNVTSVAINCTTNRYLIGGAISGLIGTVTLQNNSGDDLDVTSNGTFSFSTPVPSGASYDVTVKTQPSIPSQTCTVTASSGTVTSANITDVVVTCTTNRYNVGGTLVGLAAGDSITLRDNGGDDLVLSANGSFTFPTQVASGQLYAVTVVANPTSPISQTCTITNGTGVVAGSDVTSIQVTCTTNVFTIGGTISGLIGTVTLQNNGSDNLDLTSNGTFTFATPVSSGKPYAVTVFANPPPPVSQTCTVINGTGIVAGGDITDVQVVCTTDQRCGNGILDPGEQCDDGNTTNADGCENSCVISEFAYIKASNTHAGSEFGTSIAVSADGSTLAVGAPFESSGAIGINGDQADSSAPGSGAVYVFKRSGSTWSQQAYIKASNTGTGDQFGSSVALSADGSTLTVGAPFESSGATGINGDQANDSTPKSGAVYVFTRSGSTWSQQEYIKAFNTDPNDQFGQSVALSADGSILAVGALNESSTAIGINGDQANNAAANAGAVYVFTRSGTTWSQEAYVKQSNTEKNDLFGQSVALSGDGSTLAVGAIGEDSVATGINGNQADNTKSAAGAVYVFTRSGSTWSQQAYVKASNTAAGDDFGQSVALSGDGSTLAVGALGEDSAATGVNGNQADNLATNAGAVYVFTRSGTTWSQQAYVKASNTGTGDQFGFNVALSVDGATLAVGAFLEDSGATGINGNGNDNSAVDAGAVYAFMRTGTTWSQQSYVKASNTDAVDQFGRSVALSAGGTLAVSARKEASSAIGIGGDQSNNGAAAAGAVYVHMLP